MFDQEGRTAAFIHLRVVFREARLVGNLVNKCVGREGGAKLVLP